MPQRDRESVARLPPSPPPKKRAEGRYMHSCLLLTSGPTFTPTRRAPSAGLNHMIRGEREFRADDDEEEEEGDSARWRRGPKYKFTEVDSAASQVKSPLPPSVLLLLPTPPQSSPSPLFKPVGIDAHIASGLSDSLAAVRAVGRRRRRRNKRPTPIEEAPPLLAKSVISFTCPCRPLLVVIVAHAAAASSSY